MLYTSAMTLADRDLSRFAWNTLRRYHHVPSTASMLMDTHRLPSGQKNNAIKQATQIRQCLIQAKEYRDAAEATTLATKPTLLYYSIMCLALAQILCNGTGDVSLDRARGENAHHGLRFSAGTPQKGAYKISDSANILTAKPVIIDGQRRGTFELWCQQSQEDPVVGNCRRQAGSLQQIGAEILLRDENKKFSFLRADGISLLDFFKSMPALSQNMHLRSEIVRAKISRVVENENSFLHCTFHPHPDHDTLQAIYDSFRLPPDEINHMEIAEGTSGISFRMHESAFNPSKSYIPPSASWDTEEIRFFPPNRKINEFGYLYIALYILGNYARYFPDRWMEDVETGTPLSLISDQFLSVVEWRMSLLTLSEMSGTFFIPPA